MHLCSSQGKKTKQTKTTTHKVTLAKPRAKNEVLAHLNKNLVENSVLGEAAEAARLESTEGGGAAARGLQSRTVAVAAL